MRNKVYHWRDAMPRKSDLEIQREINEFVNKGGKVTELREDDGRYEKAGAKVGKKLTGAIRIFSKEEALTKR